MTSTNAHCDACDGLKVVHSLLQRQKPEQDGKLFSNIMLAVNSKFEISALEFVYDHKQTPATKSQRSLG